MRARLASAGRLLLSLALLASFLAASPAAAGELPADLASLVEAERAFARDGVSMGVRDAFLAHFAEEGIAFYPHPVNAREAMRLRPVAPRPPAVILDWEPETGQVSAAGDLGYNTGPFRLSLRDGSRPPSFGSFYSVWRRQAGGSWAVVLDYGVGGPDPGPLRPRAYRPAYPAGPKTTSHPAGSSGEPLLRAERSLAGRVAAVGWDAACPGLFAESSRSLRDGAAPASGRDAACALASPGAEPVSWEPLEADLADSGDLGYTYGRYRKGREAGYFSRVWHRRADGAFEVLLDVASAVPGEEPSARPPASGEVVTWVPAMPRVRVRKDVVFREEPGTRLTLDLYVPPGPATIGARPAVVFVNGSGDSEGSPARKESGPVRSWARRVAAEGLLAVTFRSRGPDASADLRALLAYLRKEATSLGLDPSRLVLWSSSGDVAVALTVAMAETEPGLRGVVALYGAAALPSIRGDLPVLVVRTAADEAASIEAVDAMAAAARKAKAPWTVVDLPGAPRGFDVLDSGDASRRTVELTVDWMRRQLEEPPRSPGR